MTTQQDPYVWFCRDCKRMGEMFANDDIDRSTAVVEHRTSSPSCDGLVRFVSKTDADKDPSFAAYKNWTD